MNAFAGRFVRSTKSEGLESALIAGGPTLSEGRAEVRNHLGGLLKYYYREAA
jgi:hypothetical protein